VTIYRLASHRDYIPLGVTPSIYTALCHTVTIYRFVSHRHYIPLGVSPSLYTAWCHTVTIYRLVLHCHYILLVVTPSLYTAWRHKRHCYTNWCHKLSSVTVIPHQFFLNSLLNSNISLLRSTSPVMCRCTLLISCYSSPPALFYPYTFHYFFILKADHFSCGLPKLHKFICYIVAGK